MIGKPPPSSLYGIALALACVSTVTVETSGARKTSYFYFPEPVQLSSTILRAGTHRFERVGKNGYEFDVVRVRSADGSSTHFVGLTMRVKRPVSVRTGSVIVFGERKPTASRVINEWHPDGKLRSDKFIS